MQMADKKPLWEVMQEAHVNDVGVLADVYGNEYQGTADRETYAAILRAIANEVVPEEVGDPFDDIETMHHIDSRMETRARLLQAAAEAEGMS
jgi:hypothetical protein